MAALKEQMKLKTYIDQEISMKIKSVIQEQVTKLFSEYITKREIQELQDEKKKQLVVFGDDEDSDEGNKEDSDNDFTKEDRIAMRQKLSGVNDTGDSYLME